jgi:hypothetical protein
VKTAQERQLAIVQALHTEAQPIDAQAAEGNEIRFIDGAWVGLQSHLSVLSHRRKASNCRKYVLDLLCQ